MNMAAKQAIWVILGGTCRGRWGWLWGWTGLFVAQSFRCVVQHSIRRLAPSLRIRKGGTSGMSRFARHDCFFFTDGVMIHFRFTRHCSTCTPPSAMIPLLSPWYLYDSPFTSRWDRLAYCTFCKLAVGRAKTPLLQSNLSSWRIRLASSLGEGALRILEQYACLNKK